MEARGEQVVAVEVGQHEDVEKLGAWSGAEGVQAFLESAFKLVGPHEEEISYPPGCRQKLCSLFLPEIRSSSAQQGLTRALFEGRLPLEAQLRSGTVTREDRPSNGEHEGDGETSDQESTGDPGTIGTGYEKKGQDQPNQRGDPGPIDTEEEE